MKAIVNGKILLKDRVVEGCALLYSDVIEGIVPMEQLPEEMATAVHLVYFEDMSYEDAAKVMKKTKKQVDNLLYRAKGALRATLGKESELFT